VEWTQGALTHEELPTVCVFRTVARWQLAAIATSTTTSTTTPTPPMPLVVERKRRVERTEGGNVMVDISVSFTLT